MAAPGRASRLGANQPWPFVIEAGGPDKSRKSSLAAKRVQRGGAAKEKGSDGHPPEPWPRQGASAAL
jgi:hypothetical protein